MNQSGLCVVAFFMEVVEEENERLTLEAYSDYRTGPVSSLSGDTAF